MGACSNTLLFFVSALLIICILPLKSQSFSKGGVTLFGGLSIPAGKFAKTDEEGAGAAKKGWLAGGQYTLPLALGVGIVVSGRYMQNPFDEEIVRNEIGHAQGVSYSVGSYTGILPMAGVELSMPTSIGIFVNGQVGYMFATLPEVSISGMGMTSKMEAASGKAMAYGVSAGIDIGDFLVVGGSYILTKPTFEIKSTVAGTSTIRKAEIEMNTFQVYAGIRFRGSLFAA